MTLEISEPLVIAGYITLIILAAIARGFVIAFVQQLKR